MDHTYIAFVTGSLYFLIELAYVKRIVSNQINEANADSVYRLQDDLELPIMDFRAKRNRTDAIAYLVLLEVDETLIGVVVNEVKGIVTVKPEECYALPTLLQGHGTDYISGVAVLEEGTRMYVVLDSVALSKYVK